MNRDIASAPTCADDEEEVERNLQELRDRLSGLDRELQATSRSAHERYGDKPHGVPEAVGQALASVELLSESVLAALEGKEREYKKARTARSDYCLGVKALVEWLRKAQDVLQRKGSSPEHTKESLMALSSELPAVRRDADRRVVQSGQLLAECLGDSEQAQGVRVTVASLGDQLQQVDSWIQERLSEVEDSLEAWARFLELHEAHKAWLERKEAVLAKRQPLNTLAVARQCLSQCQEATRDLPSGQGQLTEMGALVQRIGQSCHVGPLLERLDQAEEGQRGLEGRLVQEQALLMELVEEWEQCERKARDCQAWLERARSSLEAPQLRRKSLRDQLALREKMLADLSSQQTKMAMSLEKLRVHLRGWSSWVPDQNAMVHSCQELSQQLSTLQAGLDTRCQELSACLAQEEQYSQDLLHLRQLLSQSEHRLKLALGALGTTPEERAQNLKLQEALKDEVKKYRQQMAQLQDRIHKLGQRQSPDEHPVRLTVDGSYRPYVRTPRGSARPSREATPEPGQTSSSPYGPGQDLEQALKGSPFLQLPKGSVKVLPSEQDGTEEVLLTVGTPPARRTAEESLATETQSEAGSSKQKRPKTDEKRSHPANAEKREVLEQTSGSAARPTYAEILSGRASPQPSGSVESTSRESPPTQQSPVRPPQQEKTMSQVEVEESASTEAEDHRPPSCQDGQLNGSSGELLSPTATTDSKRLTYAQVARMSSPAPCSERAEGIVSGNGAESRERGAVSSPDASAGQQCSSSEQPPADEVGGRRKAKKKRRGLPEEASAQGGGNDPTSKV